MSLKKGAYNSVVGLISMLVSGGISFVRSSLIINILGTEFNGLNNLSTQIFSFILIGEAGYGQYLFNSASRMIQH